MGNQPVAQEYADLTIKRGGSFCEAGELVAGALSTTGKIDAVVASATTIVALDCTDFPAQWVDWAVAFDNGWSYQLARASANPLAATITLADATAVDGDDTFVLCGVTWTAKAANPVAASHEYLVGADNAATAANLAAALAGAYGPGVTASVAPVAATDVITLAGTTATCLQFAQGTSAANEIAWAETTKLNLSKQGALVAGKESTALWKDEAIQLHYIDGWPWAALVVVNAEASTATLAVNGARY